MPCVVGLGRLSGSAIGSHFADLVTSERGVVGWQRRSALSQSRALFSCVQITLDEPVPGTSAEDPSPVPSTADPSQVPPTEDVTEE